MHPLYFFLRLGLLFTWLSQAPAFSQQLHVFYVLEQTDKAYGLLNLGNDELMTQVVNTVGWGLGYPVKITYLSKADFSRAALKKALLSLKTRPKDIIVLYYSGFGVVGGTTPGNFASWKLRDAPQKGVPVAEIEGWLVSKKVHLRLLITDCSAQIMAVRLPEAVTGIIPDIRKQVIRKLFLGTCGLVKLGSSIPSVPSWVNQTQSGSVFTNGFNRAFEEMLLVTKPADLSLVSFETLRTRTEGRVGFSLYNLPYSQKPVLEQRSCLVRRARPSPAPTPADPLANQTLNGLLNAIALNPDSVQRQQLIGQLMRQCKPDAVVQVGRYIGEEFGGDSGQATTPAATYPLLTYLERLHRLPAELQTGQDAPPTLFFHAVSVIEKDLDSRASPPIRRLTLREEWRGLPPAR